MIYQVCLERIEIKTEKEEERKKKRRKKKKKSQTWSVVSQ